MKEVRWCTELKWEPSVTDDLDGQQDQDADGRGSSQSNVLVGVKKTDHWDSCSQTDGQAESQVSCPREIHNPYPASDLN